MDGIEFNERNRMTSSPPLLASASPKPAHAPVSKPPVNKSKSSAKEAFDSEMNEAMPPSENTEPQEVTTPVSTTENEISLSNLELPTEGMNQELIPTLFPTQMGLCITEPLSPEIQNEMSGDGVIFQKTENKSVTLPRGNLETKLQKNSDLPENRLLESLLPSSSKIDQENQVLQREAPAPDSTLKEMISSVAEIPLSQETNSSLPSLASNAIPGESLKAVTTQAPSESIALSPQHHLETVLESVFEENPLPSPRRIEVKLQTPEGAKITLYIARVNQELRAQFSANSLQAFSWLQSEIHQLRSLNTTEGIRWLPAQIESSLPKTQASEKSSGEKTGKEGERESDSPLESLFEFFKPSTRRFS